MAEFHKIWVEQCEAARGIEFEFGTQRALAYLIGEKFLNFLEAAEDDPQFRAEVPAFVAEVKDIFEPWQLAEYLETARRTEPFDPSVYDDPEEAEMERQAELRRSAADLLLVERAREWLLGDGYLKTARRTEPFDPSIDDDPEEAEMERQAELRRSAADLLLVERAREWLLGDG